MTTKLTIIIEEASDGGYMYDIYEDDDTNSVDGGLCTTTMANALEMAYTQAQRFASVTD